MAPGVDRCRVRRKPAGEFHKYLFGLAVEAVGVALAFPSDSRNRHTSRWRSRYHY